MTPRLIQRGQGFSTHVNLSLPANAADALDTLRAAAAGRGFEGKVREIEANARAVLSEAGLDPNASATWGLTPENYGTRLDYAARLLELIGIVRVQLDAGLSNEAAGNAFELGALVREADLKGEYEVDALTRRAAVDAFAIQAQAENARRKNTAATLRAGWEPAARHQMETKGWSALRTARWVLAQPNAPRLSPDRIRKILGRADQPAP